MPASSIIKTGPLKKSEVEEADRIVRLAFGTFLGVPNPLEFMAGRSFMTPRFRSSHVKVIAARDGARIVGTNVVTRWGSFGFFGPLTVLPEYWNRGVALPNVNDGFTGQAPDLGALEVGRPVPQFGPRP